MVVLQSESCGSKPQLNTSVSYVVSETEACAVFGVCVCSLTVSCEENLR